MLSCLSFVDAFGDFGGLLSLFALAPLCMRAFTAWSLARLLETLQQTCTGRTDMH